MVDKKTKDKKMNHIRDIIDNPYGSASSTDNKFEKALRERLKGTRPTYQKYYPSSSESQTTQLEPMVTIHHEKQKEEVPSEKQESSPVTFQEVETIKEKEDFIEDDEDIFEIERISPSDIPDFIEVKSIEQEKSLEPKKQNISQEEEKSDLAQLPKWELVEEEERPVEPVEPIKEFTPVKEEEIESFEKDDTKIWETADEKVEKQEPIQTWEPIEKDSEKEKPKKHKKIFPKVRIKKRSEIFHSSEKESSEVTTEIPQKEEKQVESPPHKFRGYTLYKKEIDLGNDNKRIIHFFSKDKPDDSIESPLPEEYEVKINKKTGVPYIRKKRK